MMLPRPATVAMLLLWLPVLLLETALERLWLLPRLPVLVTLPAPRERVLCLDGLLIRHMVLFSRTSFTSKSGASEVGAATPCADPTEITGASGNGSSAPTPLALARLDAPFTLPLRLEDV